MTALAFLTSPSVWYLGYETTDRAYAEAQHMLESCPEVEAIIIWPASHRDVEIPTGWAILFADDLIWPSYLTLARKGYDPMPKLRGVAR